MSKLLTATNYVIKRSVNFKLTLGERLGHKKECTLMEGVFLINTLPVGIQKYYTKMGRHLIPKYAREVHLLFRKITKHPQVFEQVIRWLKH